MDEEKEEELKPEVGPTLIESTNAAAERLEAANKKQEELLERQELMQAQARLSGKALAGTPPEPEETEDEKWKREAKLRYAGTGMDPTD